MAKRMTYIHNKTLDRLLLAASSLRAGKIQAATEALDDIVEDKDGVVEDDIEALNRMQQAAFDEAMEEQEPEPHLEDTDEVDASDDGDEDDMMEDGDDEDEAVAKASLARLSGVKKTVAVKKAKVSHARKVVANLAALRAKAKRR